jgi:hypothetical protein
MEYKNRTFDGASNVNDDRNLHELKERPPISSTEEGMQSDVIEATSNAPSSISESLEPDSNVTFASA